MINFDAQSHKPLRELVYDSLKEQILQGNIMPGTRMMEVSLADEMGVSRTPVREAIRKLEKEGLVVIEPHRGVYVSDVSYEDILDALQVREFLEGFATAIAAERVTEEGLDKLERIVIANTRAANEGDTSALISGDEEFHNAIMEISGNKTIPRMSMAIQDLLVRFRYLYYKEHSLYKTLPSEHRKILAAIRSGNADEAREIASEHVAKMTRFVMGEGRARLGKATSFKTVRNRD